jgi:hypothetical protein
LVDLVTEEASDAGRGVRDAGAAGFATPAAAPNLVTWFAGAKPMGPVGTMRDRETAALRSARRLPDAPTLEALQTFPISRSALAELPAHSP